MVGWIRNHGRWKKHKETLYLIVLICLSVSVCACSSTGFVAEPPIRKLQEFLVLWGGGNHIGNHLLVVSHIPGGGKYPRNWTHPPSQPLVYVTDTDCTTTGGSNVVLIDQFKSQTFAFDCWHQWGQTHSCTFHNPGLRLHYAVKSPSRAEIWCAGPRHPPSQEQRSNWSDPVQHVRLGAAEAIHKAQIQSIFILQVTCMYVC